MGPDESHEGSFLLCFSLHTGSNMQGIRTLPQGIPSFSLKPWLAEPFAASMSSS